MGVGNDYVRTTFATGLSTRLNMGEGNDIAEFTADTIVQGGARIDMGADNDILRLTAKGNVSQDGIGYGTVTGGEGVDTIQFTSDGGSINLNNITKFEIIDLTGVGNNTLYNLTPSTLSKLDLDGDGILRVIGDLGDRVNIGKNVFQAATVTRKNHGDWKTSSQITENEVTYDVWTHKDGSTVYIQQGIEVI